MLSAIQKDTLVAEATVDTELIRSTIYRVVGTLRLANGTASAANRIAVGMTVLNGDIPDANLPSPITDDWSETKWMWTYVFPSWSNSESSAVLEFDVKTRRILNSGEALVLVTDDSAGGYQIAGGHARVLLRID